MDIVGAIQRALRIIQLDREAMTAVAKRDGATLEGAVIVAIAAAAGNLGFILRFKPIYFIKYTIIMAVAIMVNIIIMHFVAGFLGGKAGAIDFFRCVSHASIISWITIIGLIPFLGRYLMFIVSILSFILMIVVSFIILQTLHELTRQKAAIALVVSTLVCIGFSYVGRGLFMGSHYRQAGKAVKILEQYGKSAAEMSARMEKMKNRKPVEAVNFRELQTLLPDNLDGFETGKLDGETVKAPGMELAISNVKRRFSNAATKQRVEISIIDTGYQEMFMMMHFGWAVGMEYDRADGYLKTVKINGYQGKLQWEQSGRGTVFINVADRFFVSVRYRGFKDGEDVLEIAEEIDLKGIEKLD